ncbi:MAG: TldD/PmbA family protein [Candidatus Cryptobacteroides sp.]
MIPWSITPEEAGISRWSIETALGMGASQVRATLNKSMMDLVQMRDGEVDKVSHSGDRSLTLNIYADNRYGTFSVNRLDREHLKDFIARSISIVRLLGEDRFRKLAPPQRKVSGATTGLELGLYDSEYGKMTPQRRREIAADACGDPGRSADGWKVISEEVEYSDSIYDMMIMDSEGLECRHTESSFEIGCETTIADSEGNRLSGFWWDSQSFLSSLDTVGCSRKALERAVAQIGPKAFDSCRTNMIVENEVASKLVNPLISALNAFSLQQGNSFLKDSLGKKVFSAGLAITDMPLERGANGARLFDSEGVAAAVRPIIENGTVKTYFVNTYMSGKMGLEPTLEDAIRPVVGSFGPWKNTSEMMAGLGEGILVTGFNGGNSNAATGDFSYGVEGFAFRGGKIVHPVREMVITGNFLELWNNLAGAGIDARTCMSKIIPSLAFTNVDFSA